MTLDGLHRDVVVGGGGQAGLAMSHCLGARDVPHVVLERERVGHAWSSRRWDSFCLVTPNWQCQLPGFSYAGDDPGGFMLRDEIVGYLRAYAASFEPPLVEGTAATRLRQRTDGVFEVSTDRGTITADQVVLATGPYQAPIVPRAAERLPDDVVGVHSCEYRNPDQFPRRHAALRQAHRGRRGPGVLCRRPRRQPGQRRRGVREHRGRDRRPHRDHRL